LGDVTTASEQIQRTVGVGVGVVVDVGAAAVVAAAIADCHWTEGETYFM
jgi:hypothetical protein